MESLNIFIRSIFIDNMVFAFFFGMCSYIAVSKSVKTALGLGAAVTFVMVMTVPLNYLLYEFVLKAGALSWAGLPDVNLDFLTFIVFIATIAAFVQLVEMAVEKFSPTLYSQLGIFLPLITTNCAVMGVTILVQREEYDLTTSLLYAVASSLGFVLALILMAGIRERLDTCRVPKALMGTPIALIMAGLMSLAFMAFKGMTS